MLSVLAVAMVATFMTLIMTKRLSAMVALIVVPIVFGLAAGHGADLGQMMLSGVRDIAPTGIMLLFAILYFGVMIDAGLFDPLVGLIVRTVHGDPVRILVGTAVLGLLVSLDGDGATTYMICVSALLPLYRHMQLDVRMLTCILIMAVGVTNLVPWGGPTARAAASLALDPGSLFVPLTPAMLATAVWVVGLAYVFGRRERRRLAALPPEAVDEDASAMEIVAPDEEDRSARRPRLLWFNVALTAALMAMLLLGVVPLPILFMIALALALMVNYPSLAEQKARIGAHAGNALSVVSLIFAAGVFLGILSGTKMAEALAEAVTGVIPPDLGPYMAPITAALSIPFTFFISNDAFYFGVLPVLAQSAAQYGVDPVEIGRASLIGQQTHLLSPLVPSTYLLVGLAGVELGEHQRFTLKWALVSCLVLFLAAVASAAFPIAAG